MPTLKEIKSNKRTQGMPANPYGEMKKQWTITVTPTGKQLFKDRAEELGLTISELMERLARGLETTVPSKS